MKKIRLETDFKKMLADVFTPVSIYLRLRDRFRDTILLESTDHHAAENSFSFICINAIAGVEISNMKNVEFKLPGEVPQKLAIKTGSDVSKILKNFMDRFEAVPASINAVKPAQSLYGYTTYDAIRFFENTPFNNDLHEPQIPMMRYRLYQYVIIINHFKDEMFLCENKVQGLKGEPAIIESLIRSKDVPVFPFDTCGEETSNISNEDYMQMVDKGIKGCMR